MSKQAAHQDHSEDHTANLIRHEDVEGGAVQQAAGALLRAMGDAVNDTAGRARMSLGETAKAKRAGARDAALRLRVRVEQTTSTVAHKAVAAVDRAVDVATTAFGDSYGAAHPAAPDREGMIGEARTAFTTAEARQIGEQIGIDWVSAPFDVEQFRSGMGVELEHGFQDAATNVTDDDPIFTGKIALAHLNEFADYYTRLERMEDEAKRGGSGPVHGTPGRGF